MKIRRIEDGTVDYIKGEEKESPKDLDIDLNDKEAEEGIGIIKGQYQTTQPATAQPVAPQATAPTMPTYPCPAGQGWQLNPTSNAWECKPVAVGKKEDARSGDDVYAPPYRKKKYRPKKKTHDRDTRPKPETDIYIAPEGKDGLEDYGIQDFRANKKAQLGKDEVVKVGDRLGFVEYYDSATRLYKIRFEDGDVDYVEEHKVIPFEERLGDEIPVTEKPMYAKKAQLDDIELPEGWRVEIRIVNEQGEPLARAGSSYVEGAQTEFYGLIRNLPRLQEEITREGQLQSQMEKDIPLDIKPVDKPLNDVAPMDLPSEDKKEDIEETLDKSREDTVRNDIGSLKDNIANLSKSMYALTLSDAQAQELLQKFMGFISDYLAKVTVQRVQQIAPDIIGEPKKGQKNKGIPKWLKSSIK